MAYDDLVGHLADSAFLSRVAFAAAKAAQQIRNEDPATPSHAARVGLAVRVASDSHAYSAQFARLMVVAASPVVTPASTDAALDTAVSQTWNTLAGE